MLSFSAEERRRVFDLARQLTGTCHGDGREHSILLNNVRRRMHACNVSSLDDYLYLANSQESERAHLLSALTIHTTSWFRELPHFEILENAVRKRIASGKKRVAVYCAACSSGQEPYSVALLLESLRQEYPDFDYSVVASDIDPISVAFARRALYPKAQVVDIPAKYRRLLMIGTQAMEMFFTLPKNVLARVEFFPANLLKLQEQPRLTGLSFDFVICRNVFIYFTPQQVTEISSTLCGLLKPEGLLLTGHSENICNHSLGLHSLGNSVFRKQGAGRSSIDQGAEKKRVLVVEDSRVTQTTLRGFLEHAGFQVSFADSIAGASELLQHEKFSLITLDLCLPDGSGVEWLAAQRGRGVSTPVVVLTGASSSEADIVINALQIGAQDFFEKAVLSREDFIARVRALTQDVSVVTQNELSLPDKFVKRSNRPDAVLIGASTGGTSLLMDLLRGLPATFPPLIVVQHLISDFNRAFADRIREISGLKLADPMTSPILEQGTLYMALGDYHLTLASNSRGLPVIKQSFNPPIARHRPSIDLLFNSAAKLKGRSFDAYLLTGMGADGAEGLLELYRQGNFTVAQNRDSCVVFGMPQEAIRLGAARCVAGSGEIHHLLQQTDRLPPRIG